jgi:hypothetical protein
MTNCICQEKDCKIKIRFDGNRLWFTDNVGKETVMYLNPNTTVELITLLKGILMDFTTKE